MTKDTLDPFQPLMQARFPWERVAMMYSQPHRVYHGLEHVHAMLRQVPGLGLEEDQRQWMEAVIWLHDAYLDPLAKPPHNEERSAELLEGELGKAFSPNGADLARHAILASAHHARDQAVLGTLMQMFLDIDLAGLASEDREFNRQTRAVAEEFRKAGRSTESICQSHAQFALKMLDRRQIYYHPRHAQWEAVARSNLRRLAKDPLNFV